MSTAALYRSRLGTYTQGKDAVAMLADAPRMIAGLIAGASELALRFGFCACEGSAMRKGRLEIARVPHCYFSL